MNCWICGQTLWCDDAGLHSHARMHQVELIEHQAVIGAQVQDWANAKGPPEIRRALQGAAGDLAVQSLRETLKLELLDALDGLERARRWCSDADLQREISTLIRDAGAVTAKAILAAKGGSP